MVEITKYFDDGANWQAQCVLAYLRSHIDLPNTCKVLVGRYENCREQGYIFTLCKDYLQLLHIAVYEHRNMDSLVIKSFRGQFINTPRIEDLDMEDKWDYDKDFAYGDILKCGEKIIDTFDYEINALKDYATEGINDYTELKTLVKDYKGTFEELYNELKGHNLDQQEKLFDVNYKSIATTIYCDCEGNLEINDNFDVWNLKQINPLYGNTTINALKYLI